MDVYEIQRGSQGAEIHRKDDPNGYRPLVIIPHDAPDADELEEKVLRFFNEELSG